MAYSLLEMQGNIRAEFETMLQFVTSEKAQTATADQVEKRLFRLLLSLGAQLLLLFFQMRSQTCSRNTIAVNGQEIPYHSEQKRVYLSIFGEIPVWRPYFYASEAGGHTPLDAELSLGIDRYSDLLRETLDYLATYIPYNKAVDIFERILQVGISTRVQKKLITADTEDILAYYEQKPAPTPSNEAEILVIQADGKGVPIILENPSPEPVRLGKGQKRGRKKEAIVTTAYTIAINPRTPEDVVNSFFQQDKEDKKRKMSPPKPQNKHIWATLDGKEVALARLGQQVERRRGSHIQHKVALADGCEALQERIQEQFPDFTLILDFVHANEYLWKVANSLLGESNECRMNWVKKQTELMLSGKTEQIIADFRVRAKKKARTKKQVETLAKTANYFERNLDYMAYDTYLANGWPIASGVIEGACRHFVKDRFELSGMRWEQSGAENLLHLRAVAENDDWDDYHLFRRQQRHQRLYTAPFSTQNSLETLALELPTSAFPQPGELNVAKKVVVQPIVEQEF
ncbi:MAG: ISKra4 family transposase, partial [Acidimicrobiales bacterium]